MQNKQLKQLTIVEQVEQVMNMDNLKQEVQLNKPFKLGLLFKVSIKDLLKYGKDVSISNDFSLSYHNAVMKLREQLKESLIEASEFTFTSVTDRELWISWYSIESGVIRDYNVFMNEVLEFAKRLDALNIQGLELRDEGIILCQSNRTEVVEFHVLDSSNYKKELEPLMMNYRHLDEILPNGYCLKHSLDGEEPLKMKMGERLLYDLKLLYELSGNKDVLKEYELMRQSLEEENLI